MGESAKSLRRPAPLNPGSRIGLLAPSGPLLDPDDLRRSQALCQALAWEPVLFPHANAVRGYLAGNDADRLSDLQAALDAPDLQGIWCLRGGYGVTRLLDRLDFAGLRTHPKVVLGYSDITALLLAIHAKTGLVAFHGPVARNGLTDFARRHLAAAVTSTACPPALDLPAPPAGVLVPRAPRVVTVQDGVAEGTLLGGNLTLLHCLVGTPYLPLLDGCILFLEDTGEAIYAIDRMLSHLRLAGLLDRIAGLAVGHFTDRRAAPDGALGLETVLAEYTVPRRIPAAMGFPIGHVDDQWTLPVGVRARLDATRGTLTLLEPAVA